jgi:transposase
MELTPLFETALGLQPPWHVVEVSFDPPKVADGKGLLRLRLDFDPGSRFPCPECEASCAVHDTRVYEWRHRDFFQHEARVQARVPRAVCEKHGVRNVRVHWGRPGSGFTLLFEALILPLAKEMPMAAVARAVGEHDTRLWRLVNFHVAEARSRVDMKGVRAVVVDETSQARGHDYVTIFVEPGEKEARVLFVTPGRDHSVFSRFRQDLKAHKGAVGKIRDVCMDMSAAFRKGAELTLPRAHISYDPFHVVKLVSEAVDEVRRAEQQREDGAVLKGTRYTWLKNPGDLTVKQVTRLVRLSELNLATVTAYHMRLNLREAWRAGSATAARKVLGKWCGWVKRASRPARDGTPSILDPMRKAAQTIRANMRGILNYYRRRLTSGVIEGFNSIVQAARARARGYRSSKTFQTMIYLIGGRLQFNLPGLVTHDG